MLPFKVQSMHAQRKKKHWRDDWGPEGVEVTSEGGEGMTNHALMTPKGSWRILEGGGFLSGP